MPKLYLHKIDERLRDTVHGLGGYHKENDSGCNQKHEFWTKNCKPVAFTEEEVAAWTNGDFVEIITWDDIRGDKVTV